MGVKRVGTRVVLRLTGWFKRAKKRVVFLETNTSRETVMTQHLLLSSSFSRRTVRCAVGATLRSLAIGLAACGEGAVELNDSDSDAAHVHFEPFQSEVLYIQDRAEAVALSETGVEGIIQLVAEAPFRHVQRNVRMEDGGLIDWRAVDGDKVVRDWDAFSFTVFLCCCSVDFKCG